MYYLQDLTMDAIARELRTSRSTVSRLLSSARDSGLVQILPETEVPSFDTYFCYPDAMKNQAKLNVFRDWVISKSRTWAF